ncbi:uncharacterized protein L969DRAFT_90004 [Mixia osmundae IAM 14324]|uniref:Enoyl-CoA hydratase n=1 Tax=Mixia osmundae (strain CBS 9802 / IAM 14324 / JCM 22182 / KY 12970) TaxID=764103 RepID=G7DUR5_MIXOS|nr:uncharacterized protein L969DRAFT_90004 [Mixia osmundae IAM 14324]KEI37459.1 hypothetical protein L969DRAFT_90004 [Mixia osmundae IAM 14324]GAA94325.1 hypothetical protein E5Q_00975 [Mixia osmundae IAM 14324]
MSEHIERVYDGPLAIITIKKQETRNGLTLDLWRRLSQLLREIALEPNITITVIQAQGSFWSAGADVKNRDVDREGEAPRAALLRRAAQGNGDLVRSIAEHPKVLVAACQGPAIGIAAAILGLFDLIYTVESFYLLCPFASLSLVAEGASSLTFPRRMGHALANEVLLFGRRIGADRLQQAGFINCVVASKDASDFQRQVHTELRDLLQDKDASSILMIKQQMKTALNPLEVEAVNHREMFNLVERFETGKPQVAFAAIASKSRRHKL